MPFIKRKAFGQHLLKDQKIINQIVTETLCTLEETKCKRLVEIGPGRGAITRALIEQNQGHFENFVLIEKDNRFAELLKDEFNDPSVNIINEDVLDCDLLNAIGKEPIVVVSNLPYSTSVAILNRLIDSALAISSLVLMFQKEVAERLLASPGQKKRGSLSVHIQNNWEVKKVLIAKPRAFSPPPKVDSMVIRLNKAPEPRIKFEEPQLWSFLLKSSFKQPRRMLRSNFRGIQAPKSSIPLSQALEKSGVSPELRPAALNWDDWQKLMAALGDLR